MKYIIHFMLFFMLINLGFSQNLPGGFPFSKIIGTTQSNENGAGIVIYNNQLVICAEINDDIAVIITDINGNLISQHHYDIMGSNSTIRGMELDGDNLIFCGHSTIQGQGGDLNSGFVVSFDLLSNNENWIYHASGNVAQNDEINFLDVLVNPNGDIQVFGSIVDHPQSMQSDAITFSLDNITGNIIAGSVNIYNNTFQATPNSDDFQHALLDNGNFIIAGRSIFGQTTNQSRSIVTSINANNGIPNWYNHYFRNLNQNNPMYSRDLKIENNGNGYVFLADGLSDLTGFQSGFIQRIDVNGNQPNFGQIIEVFDDNGVFTDLWVREVIPHSTGYFVLGEIIGWDVTFNDIFIFELDQNLQWTNWSISYDGVNSIERFNRPNSNHMVLDAVNENLIIVAQTNQLDGQNDILLLKIPVLNNTNGINCFNDDNLVITRDIDFAQTHVFQNPVFNWTVTNEINETEFSLSEALLCYCYSPEDVFRTQGHGEDFKIENSPSEEEEVLFYSSIQTANNIKLKCNAELDPLESLFNNDPIILDLNGNQIKYNLSRDIPGEINIDISTFEPGTYTIELINPMPYKTIFSIK